MKYFKIRIPLTKPYPQYISIIPIGDQHIGNPYSNIERAKEFRDYILQTPNTYTIDMGDDMENTIRDSIGNIYEQQYSPYLQHQESIKFWRPVAQAKKLLCVIDDNHSYRSRNITDTRWTEDLCDKIGARYGGYGTFLNLRVGPQQYTIYVVHGRGSATTAAGKLNSLIKMSNKCVADIYLRGHHHSKVIHQDEIKHLTKFGLQEHKRTFGITGSFLEWDNSYAEIREYPISVKGCIKLKLFTWHWDCHISL